MAQFQVLRSMYSFYLHRTQKHKKDNLFYAFGIYECKTLVKLKLGFVISDVSANVHDYDVDGI